MGKELLTDIKYVIFKNGLGTRPKMETNEPNVYPTILGGVSRGFWSPFLDSWFWEYYRTQNQQIAEAKVKEKAVESERR